MHHQSAIAAPEPLPPTSLSSVMDQIQDIEGMLQRCIRNINRLQEQMVGPTPPASVEKKAENFSNCVKGCLDNLNGTVIALEEAINRFMSS